MRGYLGGPGRNRNKGGGGQRQGGNRGGNVDGNRDPNWRGPRDQGPPEDFPDSDDVGIIAMAELEVVRKSMSLTDLKKKPIYELVQVAESLGIENVARQRKQDVIFSLLKAHARTGEHIYGDGVLEILQDGFGFLRSADGSYLAGPDDIYVSPSQIRRSISAACSDTPFALHSSRIAAISRRVIRSL